MSSVDSDERNDTEMMEKSHFDAVIVGAGFSGLYMLHRLRDELGLSARIYEKADDVGGTWYWNQYPGARCDSESHIYCYSFSDALLDEWDWSERYPHQPEILEYLRFVTDRLELRRNIQFDTEITSAVFDDDAGHWEMRTDTGSRISAQFLITAVGCLSEPFLPDFEGLETFEGEWYHTAKWPHEPVDFGDRRVGVIGTGSSGIQAIPEIAEEAPHLTVFQRTPNYAVPAQNYPLGTERYEEIRENYDEILHNTRHSQGGFDIEALYPSVEGLTDEEIERALENRWQKGGFWFRSAFADLMGNERTNERVSEFIRSKIRDRVDDPETAEKLVPTDHPYGAKRPPLNYNNYYEKYNKDHVRLVDVNESPIEKLTPNGIRTADSSHELDCIVFATGFDAMTGTLLQMDIHGRDGVTLEDDWENGPSTYLGVATHGFPNMFTITGPQSPSVLSNMPVSIENHVEWISDTIEHMMDRNFAFIEPTKEAELQWTSHNNEVAEATLYTEADSWYRGKNVPDKSTVFTPYAGGVENYRRILAEVSEMGYEGFALSDSVRGVGRPGEKPQLTVLTGQ